MGVLPAVSVCMLYPLVGDTLVEIFEDFGVKDIASRVREREAAAARLLKA